MKKLSFLLLAILLTIVGGGGINSKTNAASKPDFDTINFPGGESVYKLGKNGEPFYNLAVDDEKLKLIAINKYTKGEHYVPGIEEDVVANTLWDSSKCISDLNSCIGAFDLGFLSGNSCFIGTLDEYLLNQTLMHKYVDRDMYVAYTYNSPPHYTHRSKGIITSSIYNENSIGGSGSYSRSMWCVTKSRLDGTSDQDNIVVCSYHYISNQYEHGYGYFAPLIAIPKENLVLCKPCI